MTNNLPRISIIIPVRNAGSIIERALKSVCEQTYPNFEVLIVDGASTDGTVEIIKQFQKIYGFISFMSEPDRGVYHAMNKGLTTCTGDWIYFLGADDELYKPDILADLQDSGAFLKEAIFYGDVIIRGSAGWAADQKVYDGRFDLPKLFRQNICHQSIFYPRSVISNIGFFNERYQVTADWDYNIRCWAKYPFEYVAKTIAFFQAGGVSSKEADPEILAEMPENIVRYFALDPFNSEYNSSESIFYHAVANYRKKYSVNKDLEISSERNINLNPLLKGISPGISLFTAIKNRKDNFEEALQTWLACKEINEIIIVDWDSEESLVPLVQKYQDGRIFLAVVKNQPKWILSYAYNLSARLTTKSNILKIDADVKVLPGFFQKHILQPGRFFCGNWRKRRNDNEMHLNGMIYLRRDDFFRVNGYNEFIKFYGWDDSDLYQRLEAEGLDRCDFDLDTLYHIPHTGRTTFQNTPNHLLNIPEEERASFATFVNRHLGNTYGRWTKECEMSSFTITAYDNYLFDCKAIGSDKNPVSVEQIKISETVAVRERLILLDNTIPEWLLESFNREELLELYNLFFSRKSDELANIKFNSIIKATKKS